MSSFNHFRERIKHVPVIGSFLYRIYLLLFFREGEIVTIKDGYLKPSDAPGFGFEFDLDWVESKAI